MNSTENEILKLVKHWCRDNLKNYRFGKWRLVGIIANDVGLETFSYVVHGKAEYSWNNEIATAINTLMEKKIISGKFEGRKYVYRYHDDNDTFTNEDPDAEEFD